MKRIRDFHNYPNINRGTYVPACGTRCGTRCRGKAARGEAAAYAAKPQATRRSRGLASCRGKAARGEAAYNLVRYINPHLQLHYMRAATN